VQRPEGGGEEQEKAQARGDRMGTETP
jgi:hypothetical protein